MRRQRPLALLSAALLGAMALSGATVVHAAGAAPVLGPTPVATGSPPPPRMLTFMRQFPDL